MFKIFSSLKLAKLSWAFKPLRSFSVGGNLYTWGSVSSGTGFSDLSDDPVVGTPRRLAQFNSNVVKVSMGQWHSAIITADGQLYTCGYGRPGCLGHENFQNLGAPELVEFFKGKKVVDVACDGSHTVALTSDGALWRWGYINRSLISTILGVPEDGESVIKRTAIPQQIEAFQGMNIKGLTAGTDFVMVFTENGVYHWGNGRYGNFGNQYGGFYSSPAENEKLNEFLSHNHLKVVKAKSSGHSTMILLSNGKLYGMGDNWWGQLGIRKNVGIILDEYVLDPTPVVDENLVGRKIVDFDFGSNSLLILTDDNKVFFSGLRLICKPTHWKLPENVKVKRLVASYETFGVITEENKLIAFNENLVANSEPDNYARVFEVPEDVFGKGEVLDIGGRYNIRYAIVKN